MINHVKAWHCKILPSCLFTAPLCLQGLNFPHAEIEEGIQHICKMLTHGDTGSPTLHWLMLTLGQAKLEVGIGIPLLESLMNNMASYAWIPR